ncbi:hypothetical protein Mal4_09240 [Maioricimonas rarisocia]|uniref:DUF4340 domain-containing protein n=1 Tax=Maioricimonas rarisocia TaxID=2528026 RepID=A0A517Z2D8_9PLAN|nr:DUF4340 domain-containing protein [Maioricimonas rarisocia]QDU36636.1 hypothetical protein Mal4_09240 [Maioricimonas rarisocia]
MINQTTRTIAFVCVAVVSVAAAAVTHVFTRPPQLAEFSDVGTEFFPEFAEPTKATALRVATYSTEKGRADVFDVEFKNGLWRIPSHHNYPADGEEQLARTATSVVGIERGALVSTSKDDHRRLGVVDPLDDSTSGPQGKGDRITLLEGDTVLVDYIIGEKKEDAENTYYVRRADEDRTYLADLDIEISTRFADWIEADLLQLERNNVVEMVADRYTVDESRGVIEKTEVNTVKRPTPTGSWTLEGLEESTEQLKTSVVNTMLTALDDMKIVGVRPKPAGLSADLKKNEGIALDLLTESDLAARGFYFHPQLGLVSDEGEFRVGTNDGVLYNMRFGSLFTGSDVEIEIGKEDGKDASKEDDTEDASAKEENEDADEAADGQEEEAEDEESGLNKSRYVFITVHFDKSLIGPEPQKPTEPTPPVDAGSDDETGKPDEQASSDSDVEASAEEENADADADEAESETDAGDTDGNADEAEDAKPDPQAEYEAAKQKYEQDLKAYESAQAEYERKLEEGRDRVKELNDRFADWYYVISADLFEDLSVKREDLVEPAEPEEAEAANTPATPAFPGGPAMTTEPATRNESAPDPPASDSADDKDAPEKPEEKPADSPQPDSDSKPAETEEPESDEAKPDESPVQEEPASSDEEPATPEPEASDSPEPATEPEDES